MRFDIQNRPVGEPSGKRFVIAEVAQAHDGSLGTAHAYIDAVARTGADAIKFQTHIAHAESTPGEPFRVKFSRQDSSRYDYWQRMEFTETQWRDLADHARNKGLVFLSSPFSFEAADLLSRIGVPAWKIGSGEVTNLPLLERLGKTHLPILLSTGLSGWEDLDRAVEAIRAAGAPFAVLQCTTAYPCPPEQLGLNVLGELRARYGCPVGLSDHSGTIFPGLAAVALGADLLEVHVVFSRECFGPDVPASVTTGELRTIVDGVRFLENALAHPIDKDRAGIEMADLRRTFGKSIVTARELPAGHALCADDLALKKPGIGMPPSQLTLLIGRRLKRALAADVFLADSDLA